MSDHAQDVAPEIVPKAHNPHNEDDQDDDKAAKTDSSDKETAVGLSNVNRVDPPETHDVKDNRSISSRATGSTISPPPMFASKPTPPHLKLDKVATESTPYETQPGAHVSPPLDQTAPSPKLNKPLPKSPGQTSPFAALFNWAAPSPSATEFSSTSSPISPSRNGVTNGTPFSTITNPFSEAHKSNGSAANAPGYYGSHLPTSITPTTAQLDEMEDELKAISVELASSIRREIDLEDLVDRLQEQINNPQALAKRTSDYFSDSGYSSVKLSEAEQNRDEIDKIQRRSDQEKASIRLELTSKLQDERKRRKGLDQQIKHLAERASRIDLAEINSMDVNGRLKELEETCGDLRRRLSEERTVKNNFEDLVTAMRGELHEACNERDNLRDEVLPQLRSRVEGLELEAAEYSNLTYESTKMQQELQMLRKENDNLRTAPRSGSATPPINRMSRAMSGGLARSNSVATGSFRSQRNPGFELTRSNSVKNGQLESREALSERLKDVEFQRDALHKALRSLLERQEFQTRQNEKRIRVLQQERDRLMSSSPRRGGFEREVSNLRTEMNVLRRRAEDALEQREQVEKGLGGLKMDLDRADEEIALLRDLLKEKDILIPPYFARSSASSNGSSSFGNIGEPVTSESLEKAYSELQSAYAESLERIKKLELGADSLASDDKTQLAIKRLEQTLSIAVSERDAAKQAIDGLRDQYSGLTASEYQTIESERALADELSDSARRVGELASQVHHQLSVNSELRQRLSNAVSRGESDRRSNMDLIADLQVRLRSMEEQLVSAQAASEDKVGRHEDEIAAMQDAHNAQLERTGAGFGILQSSGFHSVRKPSLLSPTSPRFPGGAPALPQQTFEDVTQVKVLRERVTELEKALEDAETEMQEVVARMSVAQIEVLNLQEARESAVRETRRLQKIIEHEQMQSFEQRFKTLSGAA